MKVKIFFLIFSLQFILYSCITVTFYNIPINRYSDEIKIPTTGNSLGIGLILDVSKFQVDESIYFKITLSERDSEKVFQVLINFESTFDLSNEDGLHSLDYKSSTSEKNNRVTYYYETSKKSLDLNYLKIIVASEYGFQNEIGFENTKDDESSSNNSWIIIIVLF